MSAPDSKNFCKICDQMIMSSALGIPVSIGRFMNVNVHIGCAEAVSQSYEKYMASIKAKHAPPTQHGSS